MKRAFAAMGLVVGLMVACSDDAEEPGAAAGAGGSAAGTAGTAGSGGDAGSAGSGAGTAGSGGSDAGAGGTPGCELALPASYDGSGFEANAKDELAVIAQIKAVNDKMKAAEADLTVKPTKAELAALFEGGTPTLKSVTTTYYAGYLDGLLGAFADAAGSEYVPSDPPVGKGGKYVSWIFDQNGTDLRQAFEKGVYGAAMYNHAYKVVMAPTGTGDADKVIAIFGAHPSFPGDDKAATNPDVFSAQYAERRDPKDPANPGYYLRFKAAAIRAQAAAAKGDACKGERDAALKQMLSEWELSHFATVVFYLNDAAKKLTTEPATNETAGGGLHGYGETVGFIHGFRTLPAESRKITDAQIDELLALLGATPGSVTSYKMVTDAGTEAPKLLQALQKVADIYGFSAQQIEAYKTNN
jgi:hypothetical protein